MHVLALRHARGGEMCPQRHVCVERERTRVAARAPPSPPCVFVCVRAHASERTERDEGEKERHAEGQMGVKTGGMRRRLASFQWCVCMSLARSVLSLFLSLPLSISLCLSLSPSLSGIGRGGARVGGGQVKGKHGSSPLTLHVVYVRVRVMSGCACVRR
jgi:hypothetical protein